MGKNLKSIYIDTYIYIYMCVCVCVCVYIYMYSCSANPMEGGAWWAAVHGITRSWTQLSDFTYTFHFSLSCIGEGNGSPLQCSCLENPRDGGGAWWAAVYGVAQSQTPLKRLSSMHMSFYCMPETSTTCKSNIFQ